jgi:hypothetical protein
MFMKADGLEFLCIAANFSLLKQGTTLNIHPMVSTFPKEFFILGITHQGKTFRPSDWAERLAGVMSQFRPGGPRPGSHLEYSPWCVPTSIGQVKCVIVHSDLRDYDVMAWDFCLNFAKDNDLQVSDTRPLIPTVDAIPPKA